MTTPYLDPRRAVLLVSCILALAIATQPAFATTWTVRKDGTGQFTTINAAKAVATSGDVIEVGPGVYPEEVDFNYAVTLQSTDGAATTIIDGEHVRRILIFRAGTGSVVDGFTLRNGTHVSAGGGLRVQLTATATIRNCVFENNYSEFDGGAMVCRDLGSRADMIDCTFRNNDAARHAAGALIIESGTVTFTRCRFDGNSGPVSGAIATASNAVFTVTDCLFLNNGGQISCIYADDSTPTIVGNTFVNNLGSGATINLYSSTVVFRRNILANDPNASGYAANSNDSENRDCNIYWQNETAVQFGTLNPDEIEQDPIFCNAAGGDFTVSAQGPAAPANSPCGELVGAFPPACNIVGPPPVTHAPDILTILDVPNDQGRQVRVRWQKSDYDAPNKPYTITGYAIYRAQGQFMTASLPSAESRSSKGKKQIDGWDYIATVPARGDNIYQYVAPTLCDKPLDGEPCWSVFFVSAVTPSPFTYFDSPPDSGYSEDNLAPEPPPSLVVLFSPAGAALNWEPSPDEDVDYYRIYRSAASVPFPLPATPAFTTSGTEWVDPSATNKWHYAVASVDFNGNEGGVVWPSVHSSDEGPTPVKFALHPNSPNPFNPSTRVHFDVPANGGRVTIDVFDVAGRLVRGLLNEHRAPGTWSVDWDGRTNRGSRVSSGVYFCRLRAPGFEQTLRMTLIE